MTTGNGKTFAAHCLEKNQHCQNDHPTQSTIQIQHNIKIIMAFYRHKQILSKFVCCHNTL